MKPARGRISWSINKISNCQSFQYKITSVLKCAGD